MNHAKLLWMWKWAAAFFKIRSTAKEPASWKRGEKNDDRALTYRHRWLCSVTQAAEFTCQWLPTSTSPRGWGEEVKQTGHRGGVSPRPQASAGILTATRRPVVVGAAVPPSISTTWTWSKRFSAVGVARSATSDGYCCSFSRTFRFQETWNTRCF